MSNSNQSREDAIAFNSRQSQFFNYAERHGLALFPIPFGYKEDLGWKPENRKADPNLRPIVWQWSRDWSTDRAQWLKWAEEYRCNFGIYAAASRCIVLDLDVAKDREIWTKYCEFWKARGLTPPSPQFKSARNGWHVLVKVPEGFDLGSLKQSELIPNIDTRIEGYIVAATSYYNGEPKGEDSGWYEMVAGAPPPHDDRAVFHVLAEALKIKSKSVADVDLSLLPPIDEVAARIRHAYDVGPVRREGDSWVKDRAAHTGNTNADDRARREANGYFANYAEWMPVVGAVSMLYGESAKTKVAAVMRRGRDHASDMFGSAWNGVPTTDIAYASLLRFIKASNQLGFSDGGRFAKAKSKENWKAGLRAAGIETVDSDDAPIAPDVNFTLVGEPTDGDTPGPQNPDEEDEEAFPTPPGGFIQSSGQFAASRKKSDYLIKPIFRRRYCYSITAQTDTGKTSVAMRFAAHVATGKRIDDNVSCKKGQVLYFCGENPEDVQDRWVGLCEDMGLEPDKTDVHFVSGAVHLSKVAVRIVAEIVEKGLAPDLIIVDTSAAYFETDNESDTMQALAHAKRMRSLCQWPSGPCVLVLCHPTKNAKDDELIPRGGGAFLNEVDGNIALRRSGDTVSGEKLGKFRGAAFAPFSFELATVYAAGIVDSDDLPMPTVVARPISGEEKERREEVGNKDDVAALNVLCAHRGIRQADIAKALDWRYRARPGEQGKPNDKRTRSALRRLKEKGYAKEDMSVWTATPKGQKAANIVESAEQGVEE
jgi:hypothetical protein